MTLPPPRFSLRTLGSLHLERQDPDGSVAIVQRSGKPLVLLTWLARREGRAQEKTAVARRFWPEAELSAARKSLRQALHTLRLSIGAEAFRDEGETIALRAGVVGLDLTQVHDAAARGDYQAALALCGGRFLARVETGFGDAVVGWIVSERTRMRGVLLGLLRPIIEARVRTADLAGAVGLARELLRAEPASVEVLELLCDTLVADGRIEEAAAIVAHFDPGDDEEDLRLLQRLEQRLTRARDAAPVRGGASVAGTAEEMLAADPELVGRDADITTVMQWLEEARSGQRRRCVVTGRAGVGKTRFLDAIGVRARWRGARVVRVELSPAMRDTPWSALREWMRVIGGLPGAVGIAPESAARLVAIVPTLSERFPGVKAGAAMPAEHEAPRVLSALATELLSAVSEDHLRVLLCDDVHYADPFSREVFSSLAARADLPLLELWAGRAPLDFPRDLRRIELATLDDRLVEQLLARRARLPDAPWAAALVRELRERTGGLPRLVAAQLHGLERRRVLEIVDGTWHWQGEPPAAVLKVLRTGVVAANPTLSELARTTLRVLATWHRPLPEPVLWYVLGDLHPDAGRAAIAVALRDLDAAGLIVTVADGWSVAHDAIADEAVDGETAESFLAVVRALIRGMSETQRLSAVTVDVLALLCGSRNQLAAAQALIVGASGVASLRQQGRYGRRLAQQIAQAAGHPEWERPLTLSVRWIRRQSPIALLQWGSGTAAVVLIAAWLAFMLQPRLVVEAAPMGEMQTTNPERPFDAVELVVQPRVGVFDGFGRRLRDFSGEVRVRAVHGTLHGDTMRVANSGYIQFERLTITDVGWDDPAQDWRISAPRLEFRSGPLVRSVSTGIAGVWAPGPMRLLDTRRMAVNGVPLDSTLTFQRDGATDSLRFDFTFEYTTPLATANYVVGAAGTWLPPEEVVRLAGLPRPVREGWRTVSFRLSAPKGPGPHHVIIAAAPEETVQHLFSATNWVVGAPRWRDGNDLIDLPPWALDSIRRAGIFTHDAYLMESYSGPEADVVIGSKVLKLWRPRSKTGRGAVIQGLVVRIR